MSHKVTCAYCNKVFDRDKIEAVLVGARKYAHAECYNNASTSEKEEQINRQKLDDYIKNLFNMDFVPPMVQKQIKEYQTNYKYTSRGIHMALAYWIEIKKENFNKYETIGIVPYIYNEAQRYYRSIWEAKERNASKRISSFKPKKETIKISPPQRNIHKPKLFDFLDEDDIEE